MNRRLASIALFLYTAAAAAADHAAVLDWAQRAQLSTLESGVIDTVNVAPGDRVHAGQILLALDQRPFEIALADARAQHRKQTLLRDEARREVERTRELYERTVISAHDLQVGEIAFATAEADHTSAVAALNAALFAQEHSSLPAPFDGLVLAVHATRGMPVINTQVATPLVTLAQDRPMHAQVRLDAAALGGLEAGQAATVTVNGTRYQGRVRHLGAEPGDDGHYTLTVTFDPGTQTLRAGMPARVELSR
jgi:RND family efflux transporter MFP subunit